MSRCFPYTAPVYKLNRVGDESLIESIKLQQKRDHSEAERKKEQKREKKERKRKEKKDKANLTAPRHFSHGDKITKVEKCLVGLKDGSPKWVRKEENEPLERSNITEEHELPIFCSQNSSSSFDSTQNSIKRKRDDSPPAIVKPEWNASRGHGNVVRIRLSNKKQKVVDPSVGKEPPSSSGRTDLLSQKEHQIVSAFVQEIQTPQETSNLTGVIPCRPDGEQICSTSGKTEAIIEEDTSNWLKKPEKKFQKLEDKYKDLIENWIPPSLQTELDLDDQDWLCTRKNSEIRVEQKLKASISLCCSSSSTMWPRAQFLPEADIYALPFTVPF